MSFSLTILGSNSALPTSSRFSTAQVLNVLERFFLIDCCEGAQIQCRKFKIRLAKLNHIFISHLHGDHYFGLWGMISTFNLLGREHPLHIYAHSDLQHLINCQLKYFEGALHYDLVFHPLKFEDKHIIYEDNALIVESFPLKHRIPTCGFIFREKPKPRNLIKDQIEALDIPIREINQIKMGADFIDYEGKIYPNSILTTPPASPRSYAFCSDTRFHESVAEYVQGVDLLYHEATYLNDLKKLARESCHSTALEAAKIAQMADAEKLIIGHFSARYKDLNGLLDEARSVFPNTDLACDGVVFDVKQKKA